MPSRSQVRSPPTTGPTNAPPTSAGPSGPLDRKQRTMGNEAVQASLGLAAEAPGECDATGADPIADAQAALRENTVDASVSVRGKVADGARFGKVGEERLFAKKATVFEVGVSRTGLWASFSPELMLVPKSFWAFAVTGAIGLSNLRFDFRTGASSLTTELGLGAKALDPFFGIRAAIEDAFAAVVAKHLPAAATAGDYDPYTDPELPRLLASIAADFPTCFPSEGESREDASPEEELLGGITEPELTVRVGARPMEATLDGGVKLRLAAGATLTLSALLGGTLGDALSHPSLERLDLDTEGLTLEHPDIGLLGGVALHGITFGPDLSIVDLRYTLGAEMAVGLAKLLGGAGVAADTSSPRLDALRAQLDTQARTEIPALLRAQVASVSAELPGFPLDRLIGKGA